MSHYTFIKSTKEDIQKIRRMYLNGINTVDIGKFFKIHYSTVLYWVGRLKKKPKDYENVKNLINERKNTIKDEKINTIEDEKINTIEDEKINKGKSYNEYAEEELKKKLLEDKKKEVEIKSESEKIRLENNRKIKERLYKINK